MADYAALIRPTGFCLFLTCVLRQELRPEGVERCLGCPEYVKALVNHPFR